MAGSGDLLVPERSRLDCVLVTHVGSPALRLVPERVHWYCSLDGWRWASAGPRGRSISTGTRGTLAARPETGSRPIAGRPGWPGHGMPAVGRAADERARGP